uniref:ZM domain-containing protein n=1 Tax=Elaeophora elaphi TaxID=1147741 RepID=A0A158Q7B6_9BILA
YINTICGLHPDHSKKIHLINASGSNPLSPSTETINRNLYGVESVTDIANIPKQFYGKSDLQTVNRYAFGEQSLADIRDIRSQFSLNHYEGNPSEVSRSGPYRTKSMADMKFIPDPSFSKGTDSSEDSATRPYARYTTSEIEDINACPEFVREDQVIGKKAFTREEYEELRGIPSITEREPKKSPIINRYELPDDEQSDIRNLPDIVDSQYAIGRGVLSEEEIQEIQALPEMLVISALYIFV